MTRDEIYNHLAQVYLGKKSEIEEREQKQVKQRQFNAWLVINFVITCVIFSSAFYGLTAFLAHREDNLQNRIIYSLNRGPIRLQYDLNYPYPPVKTFSLTVPDIDVAKFDVLEFSLRGLEEGHPGMLRIELRNKRSEIASVFIEGIGSGWKEYKIPLKDFEQISDWTTVEEVSFILESWNAQDKKGLLLIDEVCFSS